MAKRFKLYSLVVLCILCCSTVSAQSDSTWSRPKVAVFAPLYLDSAFDQSLNYKYGTNFPKFINPGLEFYEGVQLAIDSLTREGFNLDVHIFDTKSARNPPAKVIASRQFEDVDMVLGHVSANEAKLFADHASRKNIPFINVNYPNDAGVSNNPNYIILNSTLLTHFNSLYKFLQRNFGTSEIVVFRKKGVQEDRLRGYLQDIEKTTSSVPLKLKYVTLEDNFTTSQLQKHLDSNITNIALSGSLDVRFGQTLALQLASLSSSYAVTLFGMPTWDVIDFTKPELKGLEIYYSTPFYVPENNKVSESIENSFRSIYYSRPTDMVYRGFESMYRFSHLLSLHRSNFGSSLSDKKYNLYTDFDIQPVLNAKTMTLDYFENKKIYFVKILDGAVKGAY